jgi:hypothetical protein
MKQMQEAMGAGVIPGFGEEISDEDGEEAPDEGGDE